MEVVGLTTSISGIVSDTAELFSGIGNLVQSSAHTSQSIQRFLFSLRVVHAIAVEIEDQLEDARHVRAFRDRIPPVMERLPAIQELMSQIKAELKTITDVVASMTGSSRPTWRRLEIAIESEMLKARMTELRGQFQALKLSTSSGSATLSTSTYPEVPQVPSLWPTGGSPRSEQRTQYRLSTSPSARVPEVVPRASIRQGSLRGGLGPVGGTQGGARRDPASRRSPETGSGINITSYDLQSRGNLRNPRSIG